MHVVFRLQAIQRHVLGPHPSDAPPPAAAAVRSGAAPARANAFALAPAHGLQQPDACGVGQELPLICITHAASSCLHKGNNAKTAQISRSNNNAENSTC